jgi:hypothetical protein
MAHFDCDSHVVRHQACNERARPGLSQHEPAPRTSPMPSEQAPRASGPPVGPPVGTPDNRAHSLNGVRLLAAIRGCWSGLGDPRVSPTPRLVADKKRVGGTKPPKPSAIARGGRWHGACSVRRHARQGPDQASRHTRADHPAALRLACVLAVRGQRGSKPRSSHLPRSAVVSWRAGAPG